MRKAEDPEPDSLLADSQAVEVTGDLPTFLTSFVGRERELDELRSLFREGKRLVTLVGVGGIGKTRLALELGFSAGDLGWAKVYLVELASLADPARGAPARGNRPAGAGLLRACPGCGPACGRGGVAQMSIRDDPGHKPFPA